MIENSDSEQVVRLNARVSELLRERDGLREALQQALRQWEMYADMNEREDYSYLSEGKSAEGDLFRQTKAALASDLQPAEPLGGREAVLKIYEVITLVLAHN